MNNIAEQIDKDSNANLSPMLRQYQEYKRQYPDCLLLFQVGDFYETFFEDAVTIARVINLTLTSRSKNSPDPIPMAGVPIAVVDSYLERLVKLGYSVALVSQYDDSSVKGGVGRKLDRIVTPGITLQCDIENDQASVIAALYLNTTEKEETFAIAFSSVQTGEIFVHEALDRVSMLAELQKLTPAEIIIPREIAGQRIDKRLIWIRRIEENLRKSSIKFRQLRYADSTNATRISNLQGYSALASTAKKAVRLLVDFVDEITVGVELPFLKVSLYDESETLSIDASARRTLELLQNSKDGDSAGSLYSVLNHTYSSGGARLLRDWILNPLTNRERIIKRQDAVAAILSEKPAASELATAIKYITDFERIAARIELNIVSPRELAALRDSLNQLPKLRSALSEILEKVPQAELLENIRQALHISSEVVDELLSRLVENPPANTKEGGIFAAGLSEDLDRLKNIRAKGHSWIAELEASEKEKTGIPSLKIKFNGLQGYYIEVTKTHLAKVPTHYIKKQTTVNAERYVTEELKKMEEEVLSAESRQYDLERKMFDELRSKLVPYTSQIRSIYTQLCILDVLLSFADVAELEQYVRPEIVEEEILNITDGRHPVVAQLLKGSFIANSLELNKQHQCAMITGPNMGGKSTYLRQAGLIVVMAQIGSFVPAKSAVIGIVDKLFARMGASDDLLEGESTFMVEMREAAHIVTNATHRSLLLIDEIGRGTATSDGRAIARAILEWVIEKISCRTLFATHFHELTELSCYRDVLKNLSVGVVEDGEDILFTHAIKEGPANRSYGLEVAKLAGLPQGLLERARELLTGDETDKSGEAVPQIKNKNTASVQYEMFAPFAQEKIVEKTVEKIVPPQDYTKLKEVTTLLKEKNFNEMSPLAALNFLSELQQKVH